MLKELKAKLFQSHENTSLKFHKGVNCIYGISSAGKTSLFRSFMLAKNNRPSGFRFHSRFDEESKPTEVEIITSSNAVKFIKTKGKTGYEVNGIDFPKVGRNVPDEVAQALQFDSALIQEQLDSHFMIADSNSKFAKEINRVTNFEEIDRWTSKVSSKISSNKKRIKIVQADIEQFETDLQQYNKTDQLVSIAKELQAKESQKNAVMAEMAGLAGLLLDEHDLKKLLSELESKLSAEGKLSEASQLINELDTIDDFVNQVAIYKTYTNAYERKITQRDKLQEILLHINSSKKELAEIEKKLCNITENSKIINDLKNKLGDGDYVRDNMLKELKSMEYCPFCHGPINDDCIARLVN